MSLTDKISPNDISVRETIPFVSIHIHQTSVKNENQETDLRFQLLPMDFTLLKTPSRKRTPDRYFSLGFLSIN